MYVIGGITNEGYSSEVWKYDVDSKQWQKGQVRRTNAFFLEEFLILWCQNSVLWCQFFFARAVYVV